MIKKIVTLLILQISSFLLMLTAIFVVSVRNTFREHGVFLLPIIMYSVLGMLIMIIILKEKSYVQGRKWLLFSALSSAGFLVMSISHNVMYALSIMDLPMMVINKLAEWLHVILFITAIIISPIAYLVGVIGFGLSCLKKNQVL